eukprot:246593-Pleurochrysis_carterae.AAC.2
MNASHPEFASALHFVDFRQCEALRAPLAGHRSSLLEAARDACARHNAHARAGKRDSAPLPPLTVRVCVVTNACACASACT